MNQRHYLRIIFCLFLILLGGCAALKKRNHEPDVAQVAEVSSVVTSAIETPDFEAGEWEIASTLEIDSAPER